MVYLKFFLISLLVLFCQDNLAASSSYTDYDVHFKNRSVELDDLRLTSQELRWLNGKKNFIIAIDSTMNSALLQTGPDLQAKGINADYLGLLQQNLKVKVILRQYPSVKDADYALQKGEVDVLLTDLLRSRPETATYNVSQPVLSTFPVLVTTVNNTMIPLSTTNPVNIARVKGYPTVEMIFRSFPNAVIIDYANYYEALTSVSTGENQYFIGSNMITSALISQYFLHSLNAIKYYDCPCQHSFFITRKEMPLLPDILNRFIHSITNEARKDIIQNWLNTDNLGFINQPLALTVQEKKWIKKHPTVNVLVTSFHPPFSMTDENGAPRGIMGDLLNIIALQTGMKFVPVSAPATAPPDALPLEGKWDIFPGAIHTEAQEHQVAFSDTLITSPYVYVMQKARMKVQVIKRGMKVGLPPYYGLNALLKERHPEVEWVPVTNAFSAFHLVEEGKLDALVATQPTARYMIDHYYPNTLAFFRIQDVPHAAIAFATPRDEPELKSIIDKALNDLPQSEILRLTEKWTKMPSVTIDTWDLYSRQFYVVTVLAISLILSSLLWGFYLLREVHRRKAIQNDLENQVYFRKALSDALPTPCYVVDPLGRIVNHNNAFSQYFTAKYYAKAALPLTHSSSPFAAIMAEFAEEHSDKHGNHSVSTREMEISNGQMTRCIKHWWIQCDMPASVDRVLICGWEDITETRSLIQELEIEKNKAINATIAKSQFLATMSHEIRTPVSSIMGFLELLTEQTQTEEQRAESIKLAYSTGLSLLSLIGEILDVDKIESGNNKLQPEWIDMAEHLAMIYRAFHALAAKKNIRYMVDSSLNHNYLIMIDPKAIKQVLTNLLSNALKFTDQGCVLLKAMLTERDNGIATLVVEVVDSGNGISEEELALLFQPYSQTQCGRQQTGSGLGLMICKQLVECMQGEISVKSHLGIGTTFSVAIPVSVVPRQSILAEDHQESCSLPARLRILVADDQPTNRLLLKRQLSTFGYDVIDAFDGLDALNKVRQQHFDLLITDVNMPHMDGFSLTRALRRQNHQIIIWGLTANAQNHERERGLSYGMNLCLFKPLTLSVLKTHLSQISPLVASEDDYQHLNVQVLLENTENDPEMIREILLTFSETSRGDLTMALQTLQNNDWHAFKKHIHRLHGSASILSMTRLSEICHQLHSLPVSFTIQESGGLMDELAVILSEIEREINCYIEKEHG